MGNFLLSWMKDQNLGERVSHMYIWKKDFGMKCWYERKSGDKKIIVRKERQKHLYTKEERITEMGREGGGAHENIYMKRNRNINFDKNGHEMDMYKLRVFL